MLDDGPSAAAAASVSHGGKTSRDGGSQRRGKGRKRARKDPSPELELDEFGQPVRVRVLRPSSGVVDPK